MFVYLFHFHFYFFELQILFRSSRFHSTAAAAPKLNHNSQLVWDRNMDRINMISEAVYVQGIKIYSHFSHHLALCELYSFEALQLMPPNSAKHYRPLHSWCVSLHLIPASSSLVEHSVIRLRSHEATYDDCAL